MTYTLCILLIYYAIAYCLVSLVSAMLESVSQNVPYEVLAAQEGQMVSVRKGLSDHMGWAYTGLRSEADASCRTCQTVMCNTLKARGSCICFPKPLHRTCANTIWGTVLELHCPFTVKPL